MLSRVEGRPDAIFNVYCIAYDDAYNRRALLHTRLRTWQIYIPAEPMNVMNLRRYLTCDCIQPTNIMNPRGYATHERIQHEPNEALSA